MVRAQEEEPKFSDMKVLVDAPSKKLIEKLYHSHISTTNYSRLPLFMSKLDELLVQFGGRPVAEKEQESEEEDNDDDDSSAAHDTPTEDESEEEEDS
jgi:hypothetical protein